MREQAHGAQIINEFLKNQIYIRNARVKRSVLIKFTESKCFIFNF